MNLKIIALEPGSAVSHILELYDKKPIKEKMRLLLNSRLMDIVPMNNLPKFFASGRLIDINAGEMLSLGVIGVYYNLLDSHKSKSYQVVVGIDDSAKTSIENVLSDGAIWDNQQKQKMPFQQVMVQGYFPPKEVNEDFVIEAINDKIRRRNDYPNHCGLLVSIYGDKGAINFKKIIDICDLDKFDIVFAVVYRLPELTKAIVARLDKSLTWEVFMQNTKNFSLDRFPRTGKWAIRAG